MISQTRAQVVKLADTIGLGPIAARRRGSNPLLGTNSKSDLRKSTIQPYCAFPRFDTITIWNRFYFG